VSAGASDSYAPCFQGTRSPCRGALAKAGSFCMYMVTTYVKLAHISLTRPSYDAQTCGRFHLVTCSAPYDSTCWFGMCLCNLCKHGWNPCPTTRDMPAGQPTLSVAHSQPIRHSHVSDCSWFGTKFRTDHTLPTVSEAPPLSSRALSASNRH
jgi:hypothetical protein